MILGLWAGALVLCGVITVAAWWQHKITMSNEQLYLLAAALVIAAAICVSAIADRAVAAEKQLLKYESQR
jgi:hypothetical protein